ncbi:phosphotransferase [Microbacterium sp. ET2]|uniref:phosphotransferase n=1 Tax=Microbacterium albipurpureum TaxID=3050384 RepID=UPI00259CE0ED|nr:phosphotransferase [Microbacterium sp. ET2 (Ac-2212)]WJL96484.1 phosphotransferase [Microbacterium sp. ET2 (Ac-2212)]
MTLSTTASEAELLRDALELAADTPVALLSREPFGAGSIAGFEVTPAGSGPMTYFVDTSRRVVTQETGMLLGSPAAPECRIWAHPSDPYLPALAPAAFSHAAESLLARLGISATAPPRIVGYRAGRRAVLRVEARGGARWMKVVPPSRVNRIVATHRRLADAGIPMAHLVGWSPEGLIVLDQARGTAARDVVWHATTLLDAVDELRAALAAVPLDHAARVGLADRRDWYAARFREGADAARGARVAALLERVVRAWRDEDPRATIHGDLHFGQLFFDDEGAISGLIDVDTTGRGTPDDDAAAFIAHAVASAYLTAEDRDERVWVLARSALARWGSDAVRARAATLLLGQVLAAQERGLHGGRPGHSADDLLTLAEAALDPAVEVGRALVEGT